VVTAKFLGPSTCAHGMRKSNQILHGELVIKRKIVTGSTTPALKRTVTFFVTRMLTHGLLAVANLVSAIPSVCPSNSGIVSK